MVTTQPTQLKREVLGASGRRSRPLAPKKPIFLGKGWVDTKYDSNELPEESGISKVRGAKGRPFQLEISVDETAVPTSVREHFFLARELPRLGIPVVSLAPRFPGEFQKGVDYIGDLQAFETSLVRHATVSRHFGHKLSIHTGSDKFSLYPTIARHTSGRVHVKTAGTSYLEALRVLARHRPSLFRNILDLSRARIESDRKSYALSCQLEKVPASASLSDTQLPALLDQFDARQVLHVTFGSVLETYGETVLEFLPGNEERYENALVAHFERHLTPFR